MEGERGMPPLDTMTISLGGGKGNLEMPGGGVTNAGIWSAQLGYEGFWFSEEQSSSLVGLHTFRIIKAAGTIKGKTINLLPSLRYVPLR